MSPVIIKTKIIYLASVDIVKQFFTIKHVDHVNILKSYTYPTEKITLICIKHNLRLSKKKKLHWLWQNSNLQSPDLKSGALSVWPHSLRLNWMVTGRVNMCLYLSPLQQSGVDNKKICYREKIQKWLFILCRVLKSQQSKEQKIATQIDTHNDLRAHFTVPHKRKEGTPLKQTPILLPYHLSKSGYLAALTYKMVLSYWLPIVVWP